MNHLPYDLYRADQVRELDRLAIEYYGIPGSALMARAGQVVFDEIRRSWPRVRQLAVVCGGGNNGGDGYVVARLAKQAGLEVELYQVVEPGQLKGDARHAWQEAEAAGVSMINYDGQRIDGHELIVDALLGTGLNGPAEGIWAEAISAINEAPCPVIAADIPSGLSADSGCVLGCAVQADLTVTFIGLKRGLFTADLNLPAEVYGHLPPAARRIDYQSLSSLLRPRRLAAHKGDHGHVLVVGGDEGMSGAVLMAAEAAARMGAGLVSVATRKVHAALLNSSRPELMCHAVESPEALAPLLHRASVVAVGPGLGQGEWGRGMLGRVLDSRLPLVLDADALNLLAREPFRHENWIITPHPGEAARLLGCSTPDILRDRFGAVASLEASYGGVAILKGCGTLVLGGDGETALCSGGNPGMASGGMGDVLTGVIAALVAQGYGLRESARLGVAIHAAAADKAAHEGERGLLASDLFAHLRHLANPTKRI
jgi:NAD(P)H-hydrate epimerase